jgi:hypothetical protein
MAITAAVTISQGASPAALIITDSTLNEDSETYTDRYLTILDSDDAALPDYPNNIDFNFVDYPTGVITLTGFTVDLALNIVMTLVPTVVDALSVYTATEDVAMNRFLQQGVYNIQEARFLENDLIGLASIQAQLDSIDVIIEQQNSQTAVLYGSLTGAQDALTRGQNVINAQVL